MGESYSAFLYLIASICFIMALRGLSSPDTARNGNYFGIAGMVIAVLTTLATPHVVSFWLIILGLVIGGAIGTYIARQIQMTALPQLVAAFHSLVGLAADCVAAAAFSAPEEYGILGPQGIYTASLVEMGLGLTIGALIAGTVVVENVFALPGLGNLIVSATASRDFPVIRVLVLLIGIWIILANLLADLANAWLNPQVRT